MYVVYIQIYLLNEYPLCTYGEGNGTPLQYSCLGNPMDGGAWWATVHGVTKSRTRLSDFTFTFHFPALEKEMATHSSVLAWRIPGTGEPGGLLSMGSHRVGHDWSDLAAAAAVHLIHARYCSGQWRDNNKQKNPKILPSRHLESRGKTKLTQYYVGKVLRRKNEVWEMCW